MRLLVLVAVFCLAPGGCLWGAPPPLTQRRYLIDSWRTAQGLPNDAVTAILQSHQGYLWVGTSNGLARFDGVRFTSFRAVDTPELRDSRITCLYQDSGGALWIGTGSGLIRYEGGRFEACTTEQGLSSDQVRCVGQDAAGSLWVGTASGMNRLDKARFSSFFQIEGLPDDRINAMTSLPNGKWIVATGRGLTVFNGSIFSNYLPVHGMPGGNVRLLRTDRGGNLWLADGAGLWMVSLERPGGVATQVYAGRVSALLQRASGEIWFGTAGGNLLRLSGRSPGDAPVEVARLPSAIIYLYEDREGSLWVGTAQDGLREVRRRQLHLARLPGGAAAGEVTAMVVMPTNKIWLASGGGSLRRWQDHRALPLDNTHFPEGAQVRALAGDPCSGIWIGTVSDGLFRWHNGRVAHWSELDGLSDSDIEAVCADGCGGAWIGTRNGGLNHLLHGRIRRYSTPWGFTGNFACALSRDGRDAIWVGTTGDGLFCLANGRFTAYTTSNGLPDGRVRVLLPERDGTLWAGTAHGLVLLRDGHLAVFRARDGLPDEAICQLQDDGLGNLWVGCNSGLYRLNKAQLRDYARGRTPFVDAVSYGPKDGLPVFQCVPGAEVRQAGAEDGRLWFPTSKGLVWVRPRELRWNRLPPPVVIEQVQVENEPVPLAAVIRVPPGQERIRFQYAALSLAAPEKVQFHCRLTGFDRDWVAEGRNRSALYTKVPPGRYVFQVRACNNDGVWNQTGARVALALAPFWWNTAWFRLTALGALGALALGLVRVRRARWREIERLRVRLAGDLHDELGSSLWSITLLSQMLQKHGAMGEEERRDVGEIHRIATRTSNAIRDIVWLINPAFDTMQDLVLRMKDFAATMLRGVDYQLQCQGLNLSRHLALDFRQNVFLMFKEMLTNVAKHARASNVEIRLEEQPAFCKLSVRDNGVGFDPSLPTCGNGLANLRTRAERFGGNVKIDSQPGQGARVTLIMPNGCRAGLADRLRRHRQRPRSPA